MGFRAVKIDTLSLVKELEDSGIPKLQAEAQLRTTIKVLDMVTEEKLATKHDLTHGLHQLEEKLSAKIEKVDIKIDHAEEKLSDKIDRIEGKLLTEITKTNVNIRKTEEKLSTTIENIEGKLSRVEGKLSDVEHELSRLSLNLTIRLGGIAFISVLALTALLKIH